MPRNRQYDDDFDENGVLRDGRSLRVPLRLADGSMNPDLDPVQRVVAEHTAGGRKTITDGNGFAGLALNKPGFRLSTTANYDAVDAAYDQYNTRLRDAYKDADNSHTASVVGAGEKEFAGRRVGDRCTCRNRSDLGVEGDAGHIQRDEDGMLICVSDRYRSEDALDVRDEYKKYDEELANAWRNPPTR